MADTKRIAVTLEFTNEEARSIMDDLTHGTVTDIPANRDMIRRWVIREHKKALDRLMNAEPNHD